MMSTGTSLNSSSNSNQSIRDKIIKLTNDLLNTCRQQTSTTKYDLTPRNIKAVNELNSNCFIFIYESVCNSELNGK